MWNELIESTGLLVESPLTVWWMLEQMLDMTSLNYETCLPGEQIIKNKLSEVLI